MRAPKAALWLVDQFAAPDQREVIQGDLLEEFGAVSATMKRGSARRWFWRQTVRTLVHLIAADIRQSPVRLLLSVIGGLLLLWNVPTVVEEGVRRMHYRWQVYAYIDAYSFWLIYGVLIENVLAPVLLGALLAMANKGRESVASTGLAAIVVAAAIVIVPLNAFGQQNLTRQNPGLRGLWPYFWRLQVHNTELALLAALSLLIGGLMVRRTRLGTADRAVVA